MANEASKKNVEGKYLMYNGKPLVREGDTICYGDRKEKYFLILDIINYKTADGVEVPDNVMVQVVESANPGNVLKSTTKQGLSSALNLGMVWLEMENRK
ncbi:MAG: hypothetical protein MJ137_09785 [Clostridia bacterium]|nr:hypothetical protein [Clostridia bacterium]